MNRCSKASQPVSKYHVMINTGKENQNVEGWYLLARAWLARAPSDEACSKAYEAYQQAVYRDGRNPALWNSIAILYFKIDQYRDSIDALSRSIRLNPYIPTTWRNLGVLVSFAFVVVVILVD